MTKDRVSYSQRVKDRVAEIAILADKSLVGDENYVQRLAELRKLTRPPYRPGRGKSKGKGYEREVGKVIGEWWRGKAFRPTPQSGGWDKQAKDGEHVAYGDLYIPKDVNFPWSVECKKCEGWELSDLIKPGRSCVIRSWWKQCADDAYEVQKEPLLVFSRNNLGFMLVGAVRAQLHDTLMLEVSHMLFRYEDELVSRPTWNTYTDVCILAYTDFVRCSLLQPEDYITRTPVT